MSDVQDPETFQQRWTAMAAVLEQVRDDMISHFIAVRAAENPGDWANRVYQRLECFTARDLALAVAIALSREADQKAAELWSHLHSDRAEDAR